MATPQTPPGMPGKDADKNPQAPRSGLPKPGSAPSSSLDKTKIAQPKFPQLANAAAQAKSAAGAAQSRMAQAASSQSKASMGAAGAQPRMSANAGTQSKVSQNTGARPAATNGAGQKHMPQSAGTQSKVSQNTGTHAQAPFSQPQGERHTIADTQQMPTSDLAAAAAAARAADGSPRPRKRPSKVWSFFRPIVVVGIAGLIVWFGVSYVIQKVQEKYFEPVSSTDTTAIEVVIPKGASLSTIADILYENDLVRSKQVFKLYTDFTDNASKLKAGTYTLNRSMDFDDIIYTLRQNTDVAPTAEATLPEGLTAQAFAEILAGNGITDKAAYESVCQTGEGIALPVALQSEDVSFENRRYNLEGYLFPDTYEFYTSSDPHDVVKRQLARFEELITEDHLARASELGLTLDQVVTLASIIEKESKAEQFPLVSAVLHNRLREGVPLESDASVSYGLGITNRINLTSEELATPTAYNTYLNAGLPAGPICNPGLAAINAALYPDENTLNEGYMFFTLTDPATGVLEFSKTYEEHEAIAEQWRPIWNQWDAAQ